MSGMSGFELIRRLKEVHPEMKLILLTAFKINQGEAQLVRPSTKVDAFLDKSFRSPDLIEVVERVSSVSNS